MREQIQELWAERPALVAAAGIAPLAFIVTIVVLFVFVGGGDADQSAQQLAAQQTAQEQAAQSAAQQQEATNQPEVTVIVRGEQPQQEQPATDSAQPTQSGTEQDEQPSAQPASSEAEQQQTREQQQAEPAGPRMVAGFEVVALSTLLADGYDADALKHGTDGSEGAILPLGNGVVRSSGVDHATDWEIIVPSAGLRSAVVSLGRTPRGAMGSPDNPYVVGWLDSTPAPGEVGNSLLAGHRDYEDISGEIGTGVCWELNNTKVGDYMLIRDNALNVYYVYTVIEAVTLDPTAPGSAKYLRNTDEPIVTLITCTGSFNADTHQYSHRLVVVGELAAVAAPEA